ncbi:TPA: enoyl-CoA hydratase/isomerase family protein [Corynebacterium striatum]|nr:enoyl-CoA hydratase/isomerase family protein [Corynebacterium striatum]
MNQPVITQREGRFLVARINNSARRNAIGKAACLALSDAVAQAKADPTIRALIITGDETSFSSGADLSATSDAVQSSASGDFSETTMLPQLNALISDIQASSVPVFAACEGATAGAGASIAFACDVIVAGEGAFFTLPFGKIGLIPDGGVTLTAAASLGRHRALQLALLQDRMSVDEAVGAGVVAKQVPRGEALAASLEIAQSLLSAPRGALAAAKQAINEITLGALPDRLAWEEDTQYRLLASDEHKEGVAAFIAKRPAQF